MVNENKIAFIICYNNEQYLQECVNYISFLNVPSSMQTDIISIAEADSMTGGYQAAMEESDAKYKVYLHQDTFIVYADFIKEIIAIFQKNPEYGMLGVLGSNTFAKDGCYWDKWNVGMTDVCNSLQAMNLSMRNPEVIEPVVAIDGMIMITQYDVNWRKDVFKRFDFYDISQSIEFQQAGYQVGVIHQDYAWCYHDCGHTKFTNYDTERKRFCEEYQKFGYQYSDSEEREVQRTKNGEVEKLLPTFEAAIIEGQIEKAFALINRTMGFFSLNTRLCTLYIIGRIMLVEKEAKKKAFNISEDSMQNMIEKFTFYKFLLRRIEYDKPIDDLKDVLDWVVNLAENALALTPIIAEYTIIHREKVEKRMADFVHKAIEEEFETTSDNFLVSVVMPSYNHEEFVGKAIESVLAQTYENFEFIIVDDASTDKSVEVIQKYKDPRIKFTALKENTGFGAAEYGFLQAKGKYITTIASDDMWDRNLLKHYLAFMEKNLEYGCCFCSPQVIDQNDLIRTDQDYDKVFVAENYTRAEWFRKLYKEGNCLCAPSVCIRKFVFDTVGIFRYQYRQLQDYEYWLRLLQISNIYIYPEKLVKYRIHTDGTNKNISAPTDEVLARDLTERKYMLWSIMENMEEAFFLETFKAELVYQPDAEGYCLECEKFLVMLNSPAVPTQAAIFYYFNHYNEQNFRNHLEKWYGITRKEFWKLTGTDFENVRKN